MVEEEPLPPTERFDSPFIGHRVLLPSGQQELVSSLRCIFILYTYDGSCIRIGWYKLACTKYKVYRLIFPKNMSIFSSENKVSSKNRCVQNVVFIDKNQIPRNLWFLAFKPPYSVKNSLSKALFIFLVASYGLISACSSSILMELVCHWRFIKLSKSVKV